MALPRPAPDTAFTPAKSAAADRKETDMTANFDQARVELDRALFLRLFNAAGTDIVCLEGSLWITRDGSPKDVVLTTGETYRVEDATRVIVTAFGPSLARLFQSAAPRRNVARRRLLWALPVWGRHLAAA
jgi:hypothetical protein